VRPEVIRKGENFMASPANIKKHPIHPMLVALPIGLWIFALVCDVVCAAGADADWGTVATYCVAAGIVGALIAAVPGLIDYFSIDEAEMKHIGTLHLAGISAQLSFSRSTCGSDFGCRRRAMCHSNYPSSEC
jgi:uncharacterized membrane protein